MSWTDIEERIAPVSKFDASVRLWVRGRKTQSLPTLLIALRAPLMGGLKWKPKDTFGLQIGQGDNAGKVRVVRRATKATAFARWLKTGSLLLDFGHIAHFGERGSLKMDALARVIDPDTIEVTIPEFEFEDEEQPEEEPAEPEAQAAAARPTPPPAPVGTSPKPAPAKSLGEPPITANGITVRFDRDEERIEHAGKQMEVTLRQAVVLGALTRAMPNPVNRGFLITKVFGMRPPATADLVLDQIVMDLPKSLESLGLKIRNQKGVGFALEKSP